MKLKLSAYSAISQQPKCTSEEQLCLKHFINIKLLQSHGSSLGTSSHTDVQKGTLENVLKHVYNNHNRRT